MNSTPKLENEHFFNEKQIHSYENHQNQLKEIVSDSYPKPKTETGKINLPGSPRKTAPKQ